MKLKETREMEFTIIAVQAGDQPTQQQLVEMIHQEFDTAPDRLLADVDFKLETLEQEAARLSRQKSFVDPVLKSKVERLEKLGFSGTADSLLLEEQISQDSHRSTHERYIHYEIKAVKTLPDLVAYYRATYPFATFLTTEELDRICENYGLIHAPASTFTGEVPDKNLKEIEHVQPLKLTDLPENPILMHGAAVSIEFALSQRFYDTKLPENLSIDLRRISQNELLAILNSKNAKELMIASQNLFHRQPIKHKRKSMVDFADLEYASKTLPGSSDLYAWTSREEQEWIVPPSTPSWAYFSSRWRGLIESSPMDSYAMAPITGFHIAAPPKQFKLDKARVVKLESMAMSSTTIRSSSGIAVAASWSTANGAWMPVIRP